MYDNENPFLAETDQEIFDRETDFEVLSQFEAESLAQGEYESDHEEAQSAEVDELMQLAHEAEFINWLKKKARKLPATASVLLGTPIGNSAISALGKIAQKTLGKSLNLDKKQFNDFANFAADALKTLSSEVKAGKNPPVKSVIVKSASRHYPIILRVKGTLYGQPENRPLNSKEVADEMSDELEVEGEIQSENETFGAETEIELASELLAVQSEQELDQFLGKLIKRATGSVRKFSKSPIGNMAIGLLKKAAKKALPVAGAALGNFVVPGLGGMIGSKLGAAASNLFELELEGLSPEDRQFEVARAYVRFAGNAAKRAARMRSGNPYRTAQTAISQAARKYAPGLSDDSNLNDNGTAGTGTWYRKGNGIVIEGVY